MFPVLQISYVYFLTLICGMILFMVPVVAFPRAVRKERERERGGRGEAREGRRVFTFSAYGASVNSFRLH